MAMTLIEASDVIKCCIRVAIVALVIAPAGCSPEGAGTIKIENPQAVRSKFEGVADQKGPASSKQAQAIQIEEEAAKKHPKLR